MRTKFEFSFFLQDFTGGTSLFFMGIFSAISDISVAENRTLRMTFIEGIIVLGIGLGNAAGHTLFLDHGFTPVYILSMIVAIMSLATSIFLFYDEDPTIEIKAKVLKMILRSRSFES